MSSGPEHGQRRLGGWMIAAMWLLLLGLLTLLFDGLLERWANPNPEPAGRVAGGVREVVLKRNRYGHYVAGGEINGRPVTFFLDTGATHVSVPEDLAGRLSLEPLAPVTLQTANGLARGYLTRIDTLRLGPIELRDVAANINPNVSDDDVLLGMSALRQLEFTQRGDTLVIRQRAARP